MSAALTMVRVEGDSLPRLDGFADRTLFQTDSWIGFLQTSQRAEPVYAQVRDGDRCVGRFAGLVSRRLGLRILGSPLPGWTTPYMGFNLEPGVSRLAALGALTDFAADLGCIHLEVLDRHLAVDEAARSGLRYRLLQGFEIDLSLPEERLWSAMTPACRRCVRKSERVGVTVEAAQDAGFVDDYYSQLVEVFARQGLSPTYPKQRVARLVDAMLPTGQLLLVRARDPSGGCIATGIFPAGPGGMYFWGGASRRDQQILRPNEAVQWFAMRYWKARGITRYDMGGSGEYKRKYGGRDVAVPWLRWSRYDSLEHLRVTAQAAVRVRQRCWHYLSARTLGTTGRRRSCSS